VRSALLALGIVSLLAVVALAARGGHPNGHGRASDREVPASLQDSLVTLIAIVYVLTVLALIYAFVRYRGEWKPRKSRWLLNFLMALIVMAIVVPVGYRAIVQGGLREKAKKAQQQTQQQANARRRALDKRPKPIPGRTAEFNWSLTLAVGGLLVIGGALLVLRRRPLPPAAHGLSVAEELSLVAAASIDDLRREPDARKAVIAAYANMERVLAAHGLPRGRAEAPFEYLARILRQLEVREDAVRGLTELFERAKFSTHEIDTALKEEAIAAFAALRADLRADGAVAA
jgi:multisubunit Na+/H+ antiporter MnhG subunit